ncbi:hypothetical protein [Micromonospora carbonacea]|nr:hypothetical protein [Micromonospora carbonacea]MBB5829085.1 hypothetical protein [Micromonospora carbonacea]
MTFDIADGRIRWIASFPDRRRLSRVERGFPDGWRSGNLGF